MCNSDSTVGENIRYFIYKYDLLYDDWCRDLIKIYVKVDGQVHSITNYDDVCLANAIRSCVKPATVGSLNLLMTTRLVI